MLFFFLVSLVFGGYYGRTSFSWYGASPCFPVHGTGLPLVFQFKYMTFISYLKEITAEFHGIVSSNCDYFYLFCKVGTQKDIVNNGSIEPKYVTVVRLNSSSVSIGLEYF